MTTELEKEFFDTFGIDPKEIITCVIEEDWLNDYHLKTWYPISEWMKNNAPCKGEKECSNKCNCYQVKNKYPQITDRHYLELYCTLCDAFNILHVVQHPAFTFRVKDFKECVLKDLIMVNTFYESEYVKHKVQQLFSSNP